MSNSAIRQAIQVQAEALGPTLHAGMAVSLASALARRQGLQHDKYPHLLPFIVRVELREYLEANPLANDWKLEGDSRKMGQIRLAHPQLNMQMQFLKERRRTYPGGVPPAGKNEARRRRWMDDPLDLDLPDDSHRSSADPVRLLLLWDFLDPTALDQFRLRIAHPLEPGVYGKAVTCDLILDVNDSGEIFKSLEFTGSPDDDNLFDEIVIDEENEGGL